MEVAILTAKRSKDPSTQVGACIANEKNHIVGTGYNGFPQGCTTDEFPWNSGDHTDPSTKYPYVVHAEPNAILNSHTADLSKCSMYVTLFPCNECAKLIIQSGIRKVYYLDDKYHDSSAATVARDLFDAGCVSYEKL